MLGNDTIDHYPPSCGKIEKILCVSEKIFKELQNDFEPFFKSLIGQPRPKSFNTGANTGQILGPKALSETSASKLAQIKNIAYEPSNAIHLQHTAIRRWRRVNEWFSQYAHGIE